ncbi:MAG: RNA polymerase sigma factor [Clostridiaceae bacterium]
MKNKEIEKIYDLYYKELYLYTLSLCKNHYIAEEIVSDTFFKALVSLEYSDSNIKFWLFCVSKNLWIDYLRKNKFIANEELNENILISHCNIVDKIVLDEKRKKLYAEVLNLKNTYKEVIILFYFCDFSLNDIAKSMNISSGSARTLLFRARKKLKESLKEDIYGI